MRVDIAGHGTVPTLNITAPVLDIDLNRNEIKFLLGYRNLLVSVASKPITITPQNLDTVYSEYNGKQNQQQTKIKYTKPVIIDKPITQKPVVEETVEENVIETFEEISNNEIIAEEKVCESTVNETAETEQYEEPVIDIVEETNSDVINEDKPKNNNYRKKNKKRNRNHYEG